MYKKLIVYYFSGTGNSEKVAYWLSLVANEMDVETSINNIACIDRRHIPVPEKGALVVFISPVHGFNYPPVMQYFIFHFPKGHNPILLMDTRAGMLIGKWITPGMSGLAFYLSGLVLVAKGYTIKAMYPVDLPSNWISLHPGLNDRTVDFIHTEIKKRVLTFARKALAGGRDFRSVFFIAADLLVFPIAIAYYFIGRFFLAKTFYASRDCNHCGICVKGCPVKAIVEVDKRPYWSFRCESCMRCMSNCPKKAIETSHGLSIGFAILFYSGLWVWLSHTLKDAFPLFFNGVSGDLVQTLLFFGLLSLWYRALHALMRIKWFERAVVYTSLTWYKFWGNRYKAPKEH